MKYMHLAVVIPTEDLHSVLSKSVEEMEEAEQVTIFLILREDLSILPQKDTILRLNDIIVIRGEHS